jgi:citrate lyase subunit beta / citryl-CoA lyase
MTAMTLLPRTYLFVPGTRADRFDKALGSEADAVVLDLEDAVSPDDKPAARAQVAQRLGPATAQERDRLVVRINDASTPWFEADLDMLSRAGATTVMLPKTEHPEAVRTVREMCPGLNVLALIETARGVLKAEAIAEAEGVSRLVFGTLDFALDLGLFDEPAGLDHAASRIALASRAAGLPAPVAGVTTALEDEARLLADLARARALGFDAKLCIHPSQVVPIHRALRPTDAELAWARRVLRATDQGVAQVDGRMVDKPVLLRAQTVLARALR